MKNTSYVLYALVAALLPVSQEVSASSIQIQNDRVVITTNDGQVIDTQNLPEAAETTQEDASTDNGISIGGMHTNGGEIKNSGSSTKLENVTIINNGKKTVYPAKP